MAVQVTFPGALHGRFEGEHEYFFPAHFTGQLVGGKGFAEAHFGVPQKVWGFAWLLLCKAAEVGGCFLHGFALFGAQGKVVGAVFFIHLPALDGQDGGAHFIHTTLEPLAFGVANATRPQNAVYVVVAKDRAIVAHGVFFEQDVVGRGAGAQGGVLGGDALTHIPGGVADFEQARILRMGIGIGIDFGCGRRTRRKEFAGHRANLRVGRLVVR